MVISRRRALVGLSVSVLLAACGGTPPAPTAAPAGAQSAGAKPPESKPAEAPNPADKPAEAPKPAAAAATKPAAAPEAAKPAAAGGPAVEVKIHMRANDDATWQDKKFIPEFNKAQSKIVVKQETLPDQPEYFPKVAALHATGTIGDVVWASMAGFR